MTITFTGGVNIPQGQLIVDRNRAPTWVSAENLGSNHEGTTITDASYSVVATDLDNDPLTYSLVSGTLPTSATLNSNGTITGPVASVSSNTTFNFTARVFDGLQSVDQAFFISVNQNASPVWSTAADLGSVDEGDAVSIQLTATDADSLPLTLTYSKVSGTLPTGVILSSAGLLSGTAPEETSTTVYMFTVRATDGLDTADRQFSLTVTDIPVAASIIWHSDFATDLIYELDVSDLSVIRSAASPELVPAGIGGDADTIWHVNPTVTSRLYELSTVDFSAVRSVVIDGSPSDSGGDADVIWLSQDSGNTVREYDVSDLSLVRSAASPSATPVGIGGDPGVIWHSDHVSSLVYELDQADFSVIRSAASPGIQPRGIGGNENVIYHADRDSDLVYELDVSDFSVISSAASDGIFPSGMGGK